MPMERSRRNFYFWILITTLTLAHWVVECDKLEGYLFPVYNTTSCPRNQSEWRSRSYDLNCAVSNGYMCIPNENITQLVEFCYRYPRIPIEKDICLILKKSTSLVEAYSCKQFSNGCPDQMYWSDEIFNYPSCLSIGSRCFLAEPLCKDERIATTGPSKTNVYFGSTIINTSLGSTPVPDIDGNNAFVWTLLIGVFSIVFTLVCTLIFIFRRGKQKTLDEEIQLSEYKDEIKESEENQDLDEESLLLPANTKTLDKNNFFGDRSTKEIPLIEEIQESNGNQDLDEESLLLPSNTKTLEKDSIFGDRSTTGIYLDGYEVWKTEMSEKYKELPNEERTALFHLLCSNENTFILENTESTETLSKRVSEMFGAPEVSKTISDSIQALQSKGFVSIENEKVTFASDDVQDETMFDYVHTCRERSTVYGPNEHVFKSLMTNIQYNSFIKRQLLKVSLESSVRYFRSRNFEGKGKFVRCFVKDHRKETSYEEIFTMIISKLGKDILIHGILDDKALHPSISIQLKIPEEVLRWDIETRHRYLEYLKKGKAPIYRARGMILGCAGAGKTTLLERLQKKSLEDIQKIKSTVGLDVHNDIFEVLEKEGELEVAVRKCEPAIHIKENVPVDDAEKIEEKKLLSILDFGGQCMYYACHQIYLSKRAFYILVVDMSKNLEDVIDEELCDQKDTMFSNWSHRGKGNLQKYIA